MEHTCLLQQLDPHHHNLTTAFVANYMYPHIIDNPSFEPKSIIFAVEEKFKYKISYNKAYRAKEKALEMRWGTYNARKSSFSIGREPPVCTGFPTGTAQLVLNAPDEMFSTGHWY